MFVFGLSQGMFLDSAKGGEESIPWQNAQAEALDRCVIKT